jgi:tetratricopeptide (TPR) repeat protein
MSLNALGIAAEWEGKYDEKLRLTADVEVIFRGLGNRIGLGLALNNRAYTELIMGNHEAAEPLLRECIELNPDGAQTFRLNLGLALLGTGRADEARTAFAQSLADGVSSGTPEVAFYALEGLGSTAASVAEDDTAARLWGASEAARESIGAVLAPAELALHERLVPGSRARLGDERFARAWAEGKAMPTERAIELALGEDAG